MEALKQTQTSNHNKKHLVLAIVIVSLINSVAITAVILLKPYISIKPDIFSKIFLLVMLTVVFFNILFIWGYILNNKSVRKVFIVVGLIYVIGGGIGFYYVQRTQGVINAIVTDVSATTKYKVLGYTPESTKKDMSGKTVGYALSSDARVEKEIKEVLSKEAKDIRFVKFDDTDALIQAGMDGDVEFAVLPYKYESFRTKFPDDIRPFEKTHEVMEFEIELESTVAKKSKDLKEEPFTMLMMGLNEDLADSLILASFNPDTLKVTMTSIARDSYVPIACYANRSYDKINHARAYGTQCMVDTVENFMGINVDYVFETDFYALENMVDALGGLELTSPSTFAGSYPLENQFDDYGEPVMVPVHILEGTHVMDGKQVVTFARERRMENMENGDFSRQYNQQYVIKEMANKILSTRNPNTLINTLDAAKGNMMLTMPMNQLTDLMGYALEQMDYAPVDASATFRIVQTQIAGEGTIIDGVWYSMPYREQYEQARATIIDNLNADATLHHETSIAFTYGKPYSTDLIKVHELDSGPVLEVGDLPRYEKRTLDTVTVPDFTKMTSNEAELWAQKNRILVSYRYTDSDPIDPFKIVQPYDIVAQNIPVGSTMHIPYITLTVIDPEQ